MPAYSGQLLSMIAIAYWHAKISLQPLSVSKTKMYGLSGMRYCKKAPYHDVSFGICDAIFCWNNKALHTWEDLKLEAFHRKLVDMMFSLLDCADFTIAILRDMNHNLSLSLTLQLEKYFYEWRSFAIKPLPLLKMENCLHH